MPGDSRGREWQSEEIPEGDSLYMRVHRDLVRSGGLTPSIFRFRERGEFADLPHLEYKFLQAEMSTDWSKYANPAECRNRATSPAEMNGVVRMIVGKVEAISGLFVKHTPDWERRNRAHADVVVKRVTADQFTEIRRRLLGATAWVPGFALTPAQ
jgi:hypothetical protein